MPKANIDNLRLWIASNFKRIFGVNKYDDLTKLHFSVLNIFDYPQKITFKWLKVNKAFKVKLAKKKWMTKDNLTKIWLDTKKDNNKRYSLSNGLSKTNSDEDVWIRCENFKITSLSHDKKIENLFYYLEQYKNNNDIANAQALLGGHRKILSASEKTAEKYFNKNFLKKIKEIFNTNNFAHDNLNGEEKYDKDKEITKKSINPKLRNCTNNEFFNLCFYLAKFLDIFEAMLKLGDFKK